MSVETPSQDCPDCGRFVQDRPNEGLHCECGWKKPRGGGLNGLVELRAKVDRERPFPSHMDPDETHRRSRDRMFSFHPGPPQRPARGAYGIEAGDWINYKRAVWVVDSIQRWEGGSGHTLTVTGLTGPAAGNEGKIHVPWCWYGGETDQGRIEVLTSTHHPVCGDCGEPWPCRDVDEGFTAKRAVNSLIAQVQHETEFPVECPEGCTQRFKTERGARQHVTRSRRHR